MTLYPMVVVAGEGGHFVLLIMVGVLLVLAVFRLWRP